MSTTPLARALTLLLTLVAAGLILFIIAAQC